MAIRVTPKVLSDRSCSGPHVDSGFGDPGSVPVTVLTPVVSKNRKFFFIFTLSSPRVVEVYFILLGQDRCGRREGNFLNQTNPPQTLHVGRLGQSDVLLAITLLRGNNKSLWRENVLGPRVSVEEGLSFRPVVNSALVIEDRILLS